MMERRLDGGSLQSSGRFTRPQLSVSFGPNALPPLQDEPGHFQNAADAEEPMS
jgi:hypothetical protein